MFDEGESGCVINEDSLKLPKTDFLKQKNEAAEYLEYRSTLGAKVYVLYLPIVYDDIKENLKLFTFIKQSYFAEKVLSRLSCNVVHASDAATAGTLAMLSSDTRNFNNYIVSSEFIDFELFIRYIENVFDVNGKVKIPSFMAPVCKSIIRNALKILGFRVPASLTRQKKEGMSKGTVFSNKKIQLELLWNPKNRINKISD